MYRKVVNDLLERIRVQCLVLHGPYSQLETVQDDVVKGNRQKSTGQSIFNCFVYGHICCALLLLLRQKMAEMG